MAAKRSRRSSKVVTRTRVGRESRRRSDPTAMLLGVAGLGLLIFVVGLATVFGGASATATSTTQGVARAGLAGMGFGMLAAGLGAFILWVATGPIGVGWLASAKGRDGALWAIAAFILPFISFIAILVAGHEERVTEVLVIHERGHEDEGGAGDDDEQPVSVAAKPPRSSAGVEVKSKRQRPTRGQRQRKSQQQLVVGGGVAVFLIGILVLGMVMSRGSAADKAAKKTASKAERDRENADWDRENDLRLARLAKEKAAADRAAKRRRAEEAQSKRDAHRRALEREESRTARIKAEEEARKARAEADRKAAIEAKKRNAEETRQRAADDKRRAAEAKKRAAAELAHKRAAVGTDELVLNDNTVLRGKIAVQAGDSVMFQWMDETGQMNKKMFQKGMFKWVRKNVYRPVTKADPTPTVAFQVDAERHIVLRAAGKARSVSACAKPLQARLERVGMKSFRVIVARVTAR